MKAIEFLDQGVEFMSTMYLQQSGTIATFRETVVKEIRRQKPIFLLLDGANGDNFIKVGAFHAVLNLLCTEEEIDPENITLQGIERWTDLPNQTLMPLDDEVKRLIKTKFAPACGYYTSAFLRAGYCLDVDLAPEILQKPVRPIRIGHRVMEKYDQELVTSQGQALRQELLSEHDSILVIAQSGSNPCKRLADSQVVELAKTIKDISPNTAIVIASDKLILENTYIANDEFRNEVSDNPFAPVADRVILSTDINDFAAVFSAADRFVGTDTFWAHLSASHMSIRPDRNGFLEPDDLVVLYTVGHPKVWAVPGTTVIESPALIEYGKQFRLPYNGIIPDAMYVNYPGHKGQSPYQFNPCFISNPDFQLLKQTLERVYVKESLTA